MTRSEGREVWNELVLTQAGKPARGLINGLLPLNVEKACLGSLMAMFTALN